MENTKLVESQRKTDIQNREIELFKNGVVIVPYQVSGFLDYTNRGYIDYQMNPADAETFKRVWTGNDACCLNWKNSLYLIQNSGTKEMEYQYQLGEVYIGTVETNYQENRVMKDESFSEYTKQDIRTSITFRVDADRFKLNDYNLIMFYKLPELYGSTLFRIENMEKDFIGNRLIGYVITFVSVNQDFANTGRARQQNIMPSAPGQGYLECIVKDKNWPNELGEEAFKKLIDGKDYYKFYDRYITADFQKSRHNGATKVIVKCFGNCYFKSFTMLGRPVNIGDKINVSTPQRILFPINFKEVSTPTLFRTQNNSSNFYFGNLTPTLQYYKELGEYLKNVFSPINQWKYQGWLNYDYNKMKATNPLNSSGNYSYTIYGWINQDNIVEDWIFNVESTTINTSGIYGVATKYTIGGEKAIHDHLFDNFWSEKNVKLLPIEKQNTLDFGPTLMSMIGSGIDKVISGALSFDWISVGLGTALSLIGIVGVLATKLAPQKLTTCRGIINAAILDFNNDLFDGGNKMPFNMLDNNSNETPNTLFFDGSTLNTCFEADITDLFTSDRLPDKVLSTMNIGQKTYDDGTNILDNGQELLLNGDARLTLPGGMATTGYIIDGFKLCAIFNGEFSVEFKNAFGDVIWSGVYQSEGKWTKSMREIWTEKNTSVFGRENVFYSEPIPYPKPIDLLSGLNIQLNNIKLKEQVLSNNDWINPIKTDNVGNYTPGFIKSWGWLPLRSNLWPDGYNSQVHKVYKYDDVITNKEDFVKKYPILKVNAYVEANGLYSVSNYKYSNKIAVATVKIDLRKINLDDFEITFNPNSCNSNTVLNKIWWGNDDGAGLYNFNVFKKINVFMRDYWYENGQKVNGISLQFTTIPEDTNLQTIIDNSYYDNIMDFNPKIATIYGGAGAPKPRGKIAIGYEFEFISEQNI